MRTAIALLALLAVAGCSSDGRTSGPDAPGPLPPGPGPLITLRGFVVDESGLCIAGATVRIIQGQSLDQSASQVTPCSESSGGFQLRDLVAGLSLSVRAEAAGFQNRVTTLTPTAGAQPVTIILTPDR